MPKKFKYYLVRLIDDYYLARGEEIYEDEIEGLALVRIDEYKGSLQFKGQWYIIDVASGLGVGVTPSLSKKKIVEQFTSKYSEKYRELIFNARMNKTYLQKRIPEMNIEKEAWRKSGYEVE